MYTICRLPLCSLLVCCIPWLLLLLLLLPRRAPFKWGLSHWQRADAAHRVAQQLNWIEPKLKRVEEEKKKKKQNATNFEKSTKQTKANVKNVDHMVDNDGRIRWIRWRMRLLWLCVAFFFLSLFVFLVETKFIYLLFGSINKKAACLKFKWNNALCGWRK